MTSAADRSAVGPSGVRKHLRACAAAFTFLTRLPLFGLANHDPGDLARSAPWFPLVGLAVAVVGGIVYAAAASLWSPLLAIILSVAATVWMTGAFHEDALADAFDGFGGGWNTAQVLAIMKDSRVGAYALVGVVLVLAVKIAALHAMAVATSGDDGAIRGGVMAVGRALLAAHVLARWSSVPLIRAYRYVRIAAEGERPSAGRPFVESVTMGQVVGATLLALVIVVGVLQQAAIAPIIVALIVTAVAGRYFDRRIGGITGDALGAANLGVELAVYLTLAAHWAFA
mgnify:FL=1